MSKLRAFQVDMDDYEGMKSVVVFAKSSAEARRKGANQLDTDFEDVSSCRRKSEFDQYAERGFVPIEVLIDHGWWCECTGCLQTVTRDYEGSDGEELTPVYTDHDVWCTPECKASYDRERHRMKRIDGLAKAAMSRMLTKRYPEATAKDYHVYSRGTKIASALVRFDFPGSQYGGTLRFRCEYTPATREKPALFIANGDLDAWNTYAASVSRSEPFSPVEGGGI